MASHSVVNLGYGSDYVSYDPVDQLKVSLNKLTVAIQKIGDVLGAAKEAPIAAVSEKKTHEVVQDEKDLKIDGNSPCDSEESKKAAKKGKNEEHKSGEEIKAQRANKAAQKKARAELAAAKKATTRDLTKQQERSKSEKDSQENLTTSEMASSNSRINHQALSDDQKNVSVAKSALRTDGKQQTVREVKFDLSNKIVKSPSEDSTGSDIPLGPCSESPPPPSTAHIHPAFLDLVVRCEQDIIDEVDTLCVNFIIAFKEYLSDWASQRKKENRDPSSIGHDLDNAIRPQIAYLTQDGRWPLPYALGNIVRQLKKEIMKLGTVGRNGRVQTVEDINKWLVDSEEENFSIAYHAISDYLLGKMKTSPNVITYSWCPLVNKVLLDSIDKKFQAVFTVIDAEMTGKGMRHVYSFIERGIRCRYTDLNSIGAVMKNGSMVILGCSAVLSSGCVIAPKGSMLVALTAKAFNIPVLVVSQTFKFVDKVQSCGRTALLGRESSETVPPDLVTAIVTDIRVLPPSSAPAVLKAKALDLE